MQLLCLWKYQLDINVSLLAILIRFALNVRLGFLIQLSVSFVSVLIQDANLFHGRDGSSMICWGGGGGGGGVLCQLWCRVVSVMCAARPSTRFTTAKSCLTTVFEL
jgi:hypothetical protein